MSFSKKTFLLVSMIQKIFGPVKKANHSAGPNPFLPIRVVQPRERIFMKNDNRKKCRKNIELFNGETWRGAASL